MSSVVKELKSYLIGRGLCAADEITASRIPANGKVNLDNGQWGLYQTPGSVSGGNLVQWKRTHSITVLHRNKSGEALYEKDDQLLAAIENCITLPSYKILRKQIAPGAELPIQGNDVHVMQWTLTLDLVVKPNINEES